MRFIGKVWRLIVGVKDALVLLFMLLFFGSLYAALSYTPSTGSASEGALVIDLAGVIVEQPVKADPLALVSGSSLLREYRLRDVIRALDTAATDGRVKIVVLDFDGFMGAGQAALSDVGAAVDRVKRSGKQVIAYSTGYSDGGYRIAAHASEVWLNPMGAVFLSGPGGTNIYFKGLMDRLGITANVYRAGAYKAAVEPFTRSDMSPEAREANQALASAILENWLDEVGRARPKAQLRPYIAQPVERLTASGGDMARAALTAGLIDKIGDRTALGARIAEVAGSADASVPGSFNAITFDDWIGSNPAPSTGEIGILTIAGEIVDGEAGPGTAGGDTIAEQLRTGLAERDLKALVVRVDSPGGSTFASERIRQAVLDAKRSGLPVVISMGSVAASGGYWVATAGDYIFAEPETITGSIGVFGILPSFEGALAKLGIGADGVKTTPLSGEPDVLRGPSDTADRLLQLGVDDTYRKFVGLVAAARKLPPQRVDQIAQGRVWDGGSARQLGLVDGFGSLDAAVAEAARRAKLDPRAVKAVWLEPAPTWIERFFSGMGTSDAPAQAAFLSAGRDPETILRRALADADTLLRAPAIQARCLECPRIGAPPPPREGGWLARLARWLG